MFIILLIVLPRNLPIHLFPPFYFKYANSLQIITYLSTQSTLNVQQRAHLQHIKLSWIQEIFDCGLQAHMLKTGCAAVF